MRTWRLVFFAMSVSALVVGGFPPAAVANTFGAGCVDEPGDGTSDCVKYYFNEGDFIRFLVEAGPEWEAATQWNRNNNVDPTDLDSNTVSLHSNSDVVVIADPFEFSGDTVAIARCIDPNDAGTVCRHWHLLMDTSKGPYSVDFKRAMVCHEEGHAVGLRHISATGCVTANVSATRRFWSDHDISHIDDRY